MCRISGLPEHFRHRVRRHTKRPQRQRSQVGRRRIRKIASAQPLRACSMKSRRAVCLRSRLPRCQPPRSAGTSPACGDTAFRADQRQAGLPFSPVRNEIRRGRGATGRRQVGADTRRHGHSEGMPAGRETGIFFGGGSSGGVETLAVSYRRTRVLTCRRRHARAGLVGRPRANKNENTGPRPRNDESELSRAGIIEPADDPPPQPRRPSRVPASVPATSGRPPHLRSLSQVVALRIAALETGPQCGRYSFEPRAARDARMGIDDR